MTVVVDKEVHFLESGQAITTHRIGDCINPDACTIHGPSDHHMREWPRQWHASRRMMERVCPHSVGHPDPDNLTALYLMYGETAEGAASIHGCDGCCVAR